MSDFEGTAKAVLQGAREAVFCDEHLPVEKLEEIAAALAGPGLRSAMALRIEQIVRHGHDAESDAMLPIHLLPCEAQKRLSAAIDQLTGIGEKQNLRVARLNLARVAALCLAGIDRLDMIKDLDR
jgi:hypothetical protein